MSYGIDLVDLLRGAATYVDRILRGAKPDELPVQLPTKFELVINLKTARALGLTIPPALIATAAAAAIAHIFETAPTPERREAIEEYLRDEFLDAQRQARADCEFSSELC